MAMTRTTLQQAIRAGRCSRCTRRIRKDRGANMMMRQGILVGFICSRCQSPEESAEAAINDATLDYTPETDAFGRLLARPKVALDD